MRTHYGYADIARRFVDGGAMRLLHVGDSIGARMGMAVQRTFRPARWVGFLNQVGVTNDYDNFGFPHYPFGAPGVFDVGNDGLWTRLTSNAVTTGNLGSGNNSLLPVQIYPDELVAGEARYRSDVFRAALAAGGSVRYQTLVRRHPNSLDGFFYLAAWANNGAVHVRTPASGTITAVGAGEIDSYAVDVTAFSPTFTNERSGWTIPADTVVTAGKVFDFIGYRTYIPDQTGFEYGNLCVGGTSMTDWGTADGVYPDADLAALLTNYDVTDLMVQLGQNSPSAADYVVQTGAIIARFRGLKADLNFIFCLPVESTADGYGTSEFASIAALGQDAADVDAEGRTLVINPYEQWGSREMNFANAGGSDFYDEYGDVDGTHPSLIGRARYAEILNATLYQAAAATRSFTLSTGSVVYR